MTSATIQATRRFRIPTTAFAKKVIAREYGTPLRITGQSHIGKIVMSQFFDLEDTHFPSPSQPTVYGETIEIEVSTRLEKYLVTYKDFFQAGMFFERTAQRMMLQHILAHVRAGKPAWHGMVDFFNIYDIGEDDYAYMSAYELWKIWKKAHPHFLPKKYKEEI
jgi:hypothetical protein